MITAGSNALIKGSILNDFGTWSVQYGYSETQPNI